MKNSIKNIFIIGLISCITPFTYSMNEKKRTFFDENSQNYPKKQQCLTTQEKENRATSLTIKHNFYKQLLQQRNNALIKTIYRDIIQNETINDIYHTCEEEFENINNSLHAQCIDDLKKYFYKENTINTLTYSLLTPEQEHNYFHLCYTQHKLETLNNNKLVFILTTIKHYLKEIAADFKLYKKKESTDKYYNYTNQEQLYDKIERTTKNILTKITDNNGIKKYFQEFHTFEKTNLQNEYLQNKKLARYYRDLAGPVMLYRNHAVNNESLYKLILKYIDKKNELFAAYFYNNPVRFRYSLNCTQDEQEHLLTLYKEKMQEILKTIKKDAQTSYNSIFIKEQNQSYFLSACLTTAITIAFIQFIANSIRENISLNEYANNSLLVPLLTISTAFFSIIMISKLRIDAMKNKFKKTSNKKV